MAAYTEYHPRWYRRRVSTWWWMGKWSYLKFILRELTSLAVTYSVVIVLWLLCSLTQGAGSYAAFLDQMKSPLMVVLNLIAFLFVLYHTITWFNLAPTAMAVRVGGKRVPGLLITLPNYLMWVVVSAVIVWLLIGRS